MGFKFYTSVAKGLQLNIRKFLGIISAFAEVTGDYRGEGGGSLNVKTFHELRDSLKVKSNKLEN